MAHGHSIQSAYHQTAESWGGTAYPRASVHSLIQACQNQRLSAKRGTYSLLCRLLSFRITLHSFAMWWHFVFCRFNLLLILNSSTSTQHLLIRHHIAKPMLAAVLRLWSFKFNRWRRWCWRRHNVFGTFKIDSCVNPMQGILFFSFYNPIFKVRQC